MATTKAKKTGKKKVAKPARKAPARKTKTATKRKTTTSKAAVGKAKVGFHQWTGHVPGHEPMPVSPKEDNAVSAREALRKHFGLDRLPAGSAVVKGCKIKAKRKASPAAVRRMKVLGEYTRMLWDADGRRKPITSYAKEAAREAKRDGKI